MVEVAKIAAARAHAAASGVAFLKNGNLVTGLHQGARTCDTGDTCADDSKMFGTGSFAFHQSVSSLWYRCLQYASKFALLTVDLDLMLMQ